MKMQRSIDSHLATFGRALDWLLTGDGAAIRRAGWCDMEVRLATISWKSFPDEHGIIHEAQETILVVAILGDGEFPWHPSSADLMAMDWCCDPCRPTEESG